MTRQKSALRVVAEPLFIAVVLAFAVRATMRIYTIPSPSMAPTLEAGDHIVATPYRGGSLKRGDVIVFRSPTHADVLAVKRVIGVPGDLIDSADGYVRIGGQRLSESYALQPQLSGTIAPQVIPAGCVFVLGDNREKSVDSRHWGVLPQSHVIGRARMILWSSRHEPEHQEALAHASSVARDPRPTGPRLGRIFKWID